MRPPCEAYVPGRTVSRGSLALPSTYAPGLRLPRHHTDVLSFGALAHRNMTGAETTQAAGRPPCKRGRGLLVDE